MGVNKVEFGGNTLVDLTGDTVNEQSLLSGYTAHNKAGELIQGLAVIPTKVSQLENDVGYAKTESPAFTGIPTAPTPDDNTNNTQIATTAYVKTLISNKVDKVSGKGLSTNDYTTAEKQKLNGIANNANNYVHPTTSGNKHIPAGGSSNKILGWSADGTAKWVDAPSNPSGNYLPLTGGTLTGNLAIDSTNYGYLTKGYQRIGSSARYVLRLFNGVSDYSNCLIGHTDYIYGLYDNNLDSLNHTQAALIFIRSSTSSAGRVIAIMPWVNASGYLKANVFNLGTYGTWPSAVTISVPAIAVGQTYYDIHYKSTGSGQAVAITTFKFDIGLSYYDIG